jgi:hypothetical protein
MNRLLPLFLSVVVLACQGRQDPDAAQARVQSVDAPTKPDFKLDDYWYQGQAEISRYALEQNRYDATHPGEVVLIFVTEDFRTDKQVKDEGQSAGSSVSVLKNIRHRTFSTGFYDYHLMTTVFTPVEGQVPHTMKVSASTLDWCGQTYMQLNLDREKYAVQQFSYFEREGDRDFEVPLAVLEDELWNRIRIAPESLPTGNFELLPAATVVRLRHLPFRAVRAEGELQPYQGDAFRGVQLQAYTLRMPELKRELQIVFSGRKPYRIEGWTDAYPSAFDGAVRTTVARRTHTVNNAYWEKNDPADRQLREKLGR